jgi:hypothetical protein
MFIVVTDLSTQASKGISRSVDQWLQLTWTEDPMRMLPINHWSAASSSNRNAETPLSVKLVSCRYIPVVELKV